MKYKFSSHPKTLEFTGFLTNLGFNLSVCSGEVVKGMNKKITEKNLSIFLYFHINVKNYFYIFF